MVDYLNLRSDSQSVALADDFSYKHTTFSDLQPNKAIRVLSFAVQTSIKISLGLTRALARTGESL